MGPAVGAASCPAPHTGYIVRGALHLRMDDGTESELVAGDAFTCAPGHDGWVVGSEPLEFLEVATAG